MPKIEPEKPVVAEKPRQLRIELSKIQLLFPAHVIYTGAISGQRYDFPGPGSVLEVDSRDVPAMLAYRIGNSNCCGGGPVDGNHVFQTV